MLPQVSVIFLSSAKDRNFYNLTSRAIETLRASGPAGFFEVIVVENPHTDILFKNYPGADRVIDQPEPFNYNRSMNAGAAIASTPWFVFSNNDVIFSKNWWDNLGASSGATWCPRCPSTLAQNHAVDNPVAGYDIRTFFSGWCFAIHRTDYEKIGGLDESFTFWCSDSVVAEQLRALKIPNFLVPKSIVYHLSSTTLKTVVDRKTFNELTHKQVEEFRKKYPGSGGRVRGFGHSKIREQLRISREKRRLRRLLRQQPGA